MRAPTFLAAGLLAAGVVLALGAPARAGGIVFWSTGARVITTGRPVVTQVVTVPRPVVVTRGGSRTARVAAHAYREGYEDGYRDGFHDGRRAEARRTVVTYSTAPAVQTVIVHPAPVVRCVPTVRHGHLHGGRCGLGRVPWLFGRSGGSCVRSSGVIIHW